MPHSMPLVLLVDNYLDNLEMYAEYLRAQGFRVIACSESKMSIDLARECVPDIILLELRMNHLNGFEVLARLKREPALARVPVIALTASVLSFERAEAMAAGFIELLPKPCFPEDVAATIMRVLGATPPHPHGVPGADQRTERQRRAGSRAPDASAHSAR